MSINTIQTATLFQKQLDLLAVQEMTTGWAELNFNQVKYNGGAEIKIPSVKTQGLANYDREQGYKVGRVSHTYETHKMTQDRARQFSLDAMDTDETNFILNASLVMSEFQRVEVIPEIDAYRISKIVSIAEAVTSNPMVDKTYQVGESNKSPLREIKKGIKAIRENGYSGELIAHVTHDFLFEIEMELKGHITYITVNQGGIDTRVPSIDGVILIPTSQGRMYSKIKINDGKTSGQEQGGYAKADDGKDVQFLICHKRTPIAVTKQDVIRIFDPTQNQKMNAWSIDYRRFHDLWIPKNKTNSVYVSIKRD